MAVWIYFSSDLFIDWWSR